MVILKDDANKMWCPMVRAVDGGVGGNADQFTSARARDPSLVDYMRNPVWSRCIGDDCMMWRFADDEAVQSIGYCGLARKPIGVK